MGEFYSDGITYKMPVSLTEFQQRMYVHLINWKWKNITETPGKYNFRGKVVESDAILPDTVKDSFPLIYPMVLDDFHTHRKPGNYPFRFRMHFNHMASSRAANVNLLLPLLLHPGVNTILKRVKPDFKSLATDKLYKGFSIGFWGGTETGETGASLVRGKAGGLETEGQRETGASLVRGMAEGMVTEGQGETGASLVRGMAEGMVTEGQGETGASLVRGMAEGMVTEGQRETGGRNGTGVVSGEPGVLGDLNAGSGTYVDIAIAYYNNQDELCLWMIDHKLTEREFAECGGGMSRGRERSKHLCEKSFSEITADNNLCYYQDVRGFRYWELTGKYRSFFVNHHLHKSCPFRNGMNQLWRKQLLGLALETSSEYSSVYFSVVKHPGNKSLDRTIASYKQLIDHNYRFSVIESSEIVSAGQSLNELTLNRWVNWYKGLYNIL
jgi:hypothetical protein